MILPRVAAGALHAAFLSACLEEIEATGKARHLGLHCGGEIWYFSVRVERPLKPTAMGSDFLPWVHLAPWPQPHLPSQKALDLYC